ncbi:hypothetical protein BDW22DRAFT_928484 [Trametopsis cervina]|nr:hypothetical protein BDW22DRAFT_928484 [Trametopsis cervina]
MQTRDVASVRESKRPFSMQETEQNRNRTERKRSQRPTRGCLSVPCRNLQHPSCAALSFLTVGSSGAPFASCVFGHRSSFLKHQASTGRRAQSVQPPIQPSAVHILVTAPVQRRRVVRSRLGDGGPSISIPTRSSLHSILSEPVRSRSVLFCGGHGKSWARRVRTSAHTVRSGMPGRRWASCALNYSTWMDVDVDVRGPPQLRAGHPRFLT